MKRLMLLLMAVLLSVSLFACIGGKAKDEVIGFVPNGTKNGMTGEQKIRCKEILKGTLSSLYVFCIY